MYGARPWMCLLVAILMRWSAYGAEADPATTDNATTEPAEPKSDDDTASTNKTDSETEEKIERTALDCSFGKLRTLIGHGDFSILGMLHNCAIFYALGDNIHADTNINVSQIQGSTNRCQAPKPIFYRQNNVYKLLVAQKMSIYTGDCEWDNSSKTYLSCVFDRKEWKKKSIKPSASDDLEIIGHTADVNSDILHVFYIDGRKCFAQEIYSSNPKRFDVIRQLIGRTRAQTWLIYMLTKDLIYQKVQSNSGIFTYESNLHAAVNNFSRGSYSALSFSNHYYLAKKTLGDGRVAYYAGKEGNDTQVCIAETSPDEGLHLALFVGTGEDSAHERIRAQLAPKPEPTVPHLQLTTMAMTADSSQISATSSSFILLLLLLFTIFC